MFCLFDQLAELISSILFNAGKGIREGREASGKRIGWGFFPGERADWDGEWID
jgi:hypothetical protein